MKCDFNLSTWITTAYVFSTEREPEREREAGIVRELESLYLLVLSGREGGWGRLGKGGWRGEGGGDIHFYFSQKPSSRRMTFIGWILNIT